MEFEKVIHVLHEANEKAKIPKTKISKIDSIFDEIENSLKNGVPRTEIVRILNEHGFEICIKTFDTSLLTLRKRRKKQTGDTAASKSTIPNGKQEVSTSPQNEATTKPIAQEKITKQEPPKKTPSPEDISAIFNSKPDLEMYAAIHKKKLADEKEAAKRSAGKDGKH